VEERRTVKVRKMRRERTHQKEWGGLEEFIGHKRIRVN
jgi:hypothetical protein